MRRQPVSTLTHTTRQVAEHFLLWREEQKLLSMIGHNGCPELEDIEDEFNLEERMGYPYK
tara:strand:+ start:1378 stop:1557 length:180 start_codon:yes stop_codon:yes gene_type:complete